MNPRSHIPVLLKEVSSFFTPLFVQPTLLLDATFGNGGYSRHLLDSSPHVRVIALDRDPMAFERAQIMSCLPEYKDRLIPLHGRFSQISQALAMHASLRGSSFDGILFDIGMSSNQLDDPSRGFSYQLDGPLDMRMTPSDDYLTAQTIVNNFSLEDLQTIIHEYGQDRLSHKIARAIVQARLKTEIHSTLQLSKIIADAVSGRHGKWPLGQRHPALKTFQALRIYINQELKELELGLECAQSLLKPCGRIAVVTFHSLEDIIVKRFFQTAQRGLQPKWSRRGMQRKRVEEVDVFEPMSETFVDPRILQQEALEDAHRPTLKVLTKKAIQPSKQEILDNPRSRSAKLRVAERTEHPMIQEKVAY